MEMESSMLFGYEKHTTATAEANGMNYLLQPMADALRHTAFLVVFDYFLTTTP